MREKLSSRSEEPIAFLQTTIRVTQNSPTFLQHRQRLSWVKILHNREEEEVLSQPSDWVEVAIPDTENGWGGLRRGRSHSPVHYGEFLFGRGELCGEESDVLGSLQNERGEICGSIFANRPCLG